MDNNLLNNDDKNQTDANLSAETKQENETAGKNKKPKMPRIKKLRNQALMKRGGYALAITAAVLAGIIIINILVGALSKRFMLDFDMSAEKVNSLSAENIDFIKGIDKEIDITVCAGEDNYTSYMQYFYNVSEDPTDYYNQTIKLIKKYEVINENIKINFVDPNTSEYDKIKQKYNNDSLYLGDIIVSNGAEENERYKILGYTDVYTLVSDEQAAMLGSNSQKISNNNIENALASAVAYAVGNKTNKAAIITGHSTTDYTASFRELLTTNNYEIEEISDLVISSIPDDFDLIVIAVPTKDFIGSELDAISDFLENDGNYGKGLMYFADATAPRLSNLSELLEQWGISAEEGVLFETDANQHIPDDPTTLYLQPSGEDEDLVKYSLCISGHSVPLAATKPADDRITVSSLITTADTTVCAPVGVGADWADASKYKQQAYSGALQAVKKDYDDNNDEVSSYVIAFCSSEFLQSDYMRYSDVYNADVTLVCANRASGAEETGILFSTKTIDNESYASLVTEASVGVVKTIFMIILPIMLIACAIYIYIRRKNS